MGWGSRQERVWIAASAIVWSLGAGCDDGTVAPEPESEAGVSSRQADADAPAIDDYAVARPRKGEIIGGEKVARTIVWPDASQIHAPTRQRLGANVRDKVPAAPLPVLVPREGAERGELVLGETWYAYSAALDGATLSIQGSAQARVHTHMKAAQPTEEVRGVGGFISSNESIWTVSWIEHGAAYSLELECANPKDNRCEDPNRALELAESMVFVGGGQGR